MKPKGECSYYLVREMCGLGIKAKEIYFNDMLNNIRKDGLKDMCRLEIRALIMAAEQRGRLDELDAAVEAAREKGE